MGHPDQGAGTDQRRRPHPLAVIGVLAALVVVAVFAVVYLVGSGDRTAKNACIGAVTDQLRAPGTAKFDVTLITDQDGGVKIVSGTVDSQNSFGALLRSNFRCTVTNGTAVVDFVG